MTITYANPDRLNLTSEVKARRIRAVEMRLEGKTFREIGDALGIGKYRASQIVSVGAADLLARVKIEVVVDGKVVLRKRPTQRTTIMVPNG